MKHHLCNKLFDIHTKCGKKRMYGFTVEGMIEELEQGKIKTSDVCKRCFRFCGDVELQAAFKEAQKREKGAASESTH